MNKSNKIVVVGLAAVGLSNAALLAQNNEVIGVDVSQQNVHGLMRASAHKYKQRLVI